VREGGRKRGRGGKNEGGRKCRIVWRCQLGGGGRGKGGKKGGKGRRREEGRQYVGARTQGLDATALPPPLPPSLPPPLLPLLLFIHFMPQGFGPWDTST
jgi:hypothetical protein